MKRLTPALIRFLPALQVANGGLCDRAKSVVVMERSTCSPREKGGALGRLTNIYLWHTSQ
jgi:hypothetical protein